ncbi:MAG: MGMT family protein, partial [Bacteroidota bacterium]
MAEIKIIDIPEKMEKYYGSGKMLRPDVQRVEEVIRHIPKGKVATIELVADKMARDVGVDMSCPLRTGNAIKKIAERYLTHDVNIEMPFWRVIRKDHKIVKSKNY